MWRKPHLKQTGRWEKMKKEQYEIARRTYNDIIEYENMIDMIKTGEIYLYSHKTGKEILIEKQLALDIEIIIRKYKEQAEKLFERL